MHRGYIKTDGKRSIDKFKGVEKLRTLEEVKNWNSYAGVLDDHTIMIDVDDKAQSEALYKVLCSMKDLRFACLKTDRGMHFYFEDGGYRCGCKTNATLLVGVVADIKQGANAYDILKLDGTTREWLMTSDQLDIIPAYLRLGEKKLFGMKAGDGRNDALFSLIPSLLKRGCTKDEIKALYMAINSFVFASPLSVNELSTILRDEAFDVKISAPTKADKGQPKNGKKESYYELGMNLIKAHDLTLVDGMLYSDGVGADDHEIDRLIYTEVEGATKNACDEIRNVVRLFAPKKTVAPAHYIKFENGVWDAMTGVWACDAESYVYPNEIPHPYDLDAYDEIVDKTLDKIACHEPNRRAMLEEMMGYCLLRDCRFRKAFILYGDKRNGKSSLLRAMIAMLGERNVSTLDFKDVNRQFATVALQGKLANIGDDISSEFIPDISMAKKLVSGEFLTADRKFKDAVQFRNVAKLIFSANDLARMKDDTGAMLDRFVIIPCMAEFKASDADYNPMIERDLTTPAALCYMVSLAVNGLERLLTTGVFTSDEMQKEIIAEYYEMNNPITVFFEEAGKPKQGETTQQYYNEYLEFCVRSGLSPMTKIGLTKMAKKEFNVSVLVARSDGNLTRIYTYK